MRFVLKAVLIACATTGVASVAVANGPGEDRAYQFQTPNQRQVKTNLESIRIQLENGTGIGASTGVGASAGLGTQTGNTLNISITGGGDNTIDVGQDNSGDQTIEDSSTTTTTTPSEMLN